MFSYIQVIFFQFVYIFPEYCQFNHMRNLIKPLLEVLSFPVGHKEMISADNGGSLEYRLFSSGKHRA